MKRHKDAHAKQAYFGARWGNDYEDQTPDVRYNVMVYDIAQNFQGWTLDYIRGLSPLEQAGLLGYLDGKQRLERWVEHKKAQAQKRAARKPKRH